MNPPENSASSSPGDAPSKPRRRSISNGAKPRRSGKAGDEIKVPATHDWRTTDDDEINKRRLRALEEKFTIANLDRQQPVFSNFAVKSASGLTYGVEIRDVAGRQFACDCVDFRINGLGTCKHVEAVLLLLQSRYRGLFKAAAKSGSSRIDIVPDIANATLRASGPAGAERIPRELGEWFDQDGKLCDGSPEEALESLAMLRDQMPELRISQEVGPWLETRRRTAESRELRHEYELKVQSGEWPPHETTVPLFPYQREGMLHLAFNERALLADEMGLGKTIQAIAACALLHRLGKAKHVLVVTPASLKTEWEEQIRRFTPLSLQLVFGGPRARAAAYSAIDSPFFTIVNYEQMVIDSLMVNEQLRPDVVILDEAQRIKNWSTKTAQAIKRLQSRYAFVLTGTPIENRIDELHSLMDFLNPAVLGPLFRFNRDFYLLDEKGRPEGFRNLDQLHARIRPHLLRRLKAEVETELPERTDRNFFVPLSPGQRNEYASHEQVVSQLVNIAKKRPLTQHQQEKLMREMAMMRMICDTNYILDRKDRTCPKLAELEKLLEECRENEIKVIVFSEWEGMLELVRDVCVDAGIGFAWHTGSVPQKRRRGEINAFKNDPECRVFLSTDSGAAGLNLQNASVVINCDLPWNPAKLEQRIARAWRKHQTRPVTVINLISENTLEHKMLSTLAAKQTVARSVLDKPGEVTEIRLRGAQQSFLKRLEQILDTAPVEPSLGAVSSGEPKLSPDKAVAFSQLASRQLGAALVRCEESFPTDGVHSVLLVVVERDAAQWRSQAEALHGELFGPGKSDPLAPTMLEVIDRATDEALQKLIAAGIVAKTSRATRPLYPAQESEQPRPLSQQELARIEEQRTKARHALGIARLLGPAGFEAEARVQLLEAISAFARAKAVQARMPEPDSVQTALVPPLAQQWGEALGPLRAFVGGEAAAWQPVAEALAKWGEK